MHKPNDLSRQIVKNMAKFLYKKDIAKYLGIDQKTLNKYYEKELSVRYETAEKVAKEIYNIAMMDDNSSVRLKALIWTMENIFNMKNNGVVEEEQTEEEAVTSIELIVAKPDKKQA